MSQFQEENKDEFVFFWKPADEYYKFAKWRAIFCQWRVQSFKGGDGIHNIDEVYGKYKDLMMKQVFSCREQWMMASKALLFAKGEYEKQNLQIFHMIMNSSKKGISCYIVCYLTLFKQYFSNIV